MATSGAILERDSAEADSFARDGFLGPVRIFDGAQCRAIVRHFERADRPEPAMWPKGAAVTDPVLSGLARNPTLLQLLTPLLGEDIILWGCSFIKREPGQRHSWHVDMETASPDGRFVTAWIGLENTAAASGVRLIAGSHLCGKTAQQCLAESGCTTRRDTPDETVVEWAKATNPEARLAEPELTDGEAILFDGRMWHGSHNRLERETRSALLLQFASADTPVLVPDPRVVTWPFKYLKARPPVLLVQGTAARSPNRIVPPPANEVGPISPLIRRLDTPLAEEPGKRWRPYPLFRGSTPALEFMQCHAAVLSPGHSPHPPHAHDDEELLIILHGEAELLIADRPEYESARAVPVKAGDFAFYPSHQHHTIRNAANSPVSYLMFRWRRARPVTPPEDRLRTTVYQAPAMPEAGARGGFAANRVLEKPTRWLRKLHCHTTRLEAGAGYAPHIDPYDVAILIQSGRVRTLRRGAGPGSLIYYPAGEMHGMRNIGDEPARYTVFEFHGARLSAAQAVEGAPEGRAPALQQQ